MFEDVIYKMLVYLMCFLISIYCLSSINFEKYIKKNSTLKFWCLYMLLAMALGYLVANFLMAFTIKLF